MRRSDRVALQANSFFDCRVCGDKAVANRFEVEESVFRIGETFEYGECASCGSISCLDFADQATLYPANYYSLSVDPWDVFASPLAQFAARALANSAISGRGILAGALRVTSPVKQVRTLARIMWGVSRAGVESTSRVTNVLDVGTGSGIVATCLSLGNSVQVEGIDPFMLKEFRATKLNLTRTDLDAVDGARDLIMFNHSLEHMDDPLGELRKARELLSVGGRILVRIPTVSSDAWKQFGVDWYQLDSPRHRFIPSRRGLLTLAERAGLFVESSGGDSTTAQFWLSRLVKNGLSQMDPLTGYHAYRRSPRGHRVSDFVRTVRSNRLGTSDQVVVVMRPELARMREE